MELAFFLIAISLCYWALFTWAFHALPSERWQFIASVPLVKFENGAWKGLNLTYYGFFSALAYAIASAIFILLAASLGISLLAALIFCFFVLVLCAPASKVVAFLVEGKQHTFTVGGASFVGIIISPAILWAMNQLDIAWLNVPVAPLLCAAAIAYAIGEGTGRLACISFGCCYGKSLEESSEFVRKAFRRFNFVFSGKTKKIAYASNMDGKACVPVQALTAILYVVTALVGILLFFLGFFKLSLFLVTVITQLWRFFSETMRADYRGESKVSAYQKMALISIVYISMLSFVLPVHNQLAALSRGLQGFWSVEVLLFIEVVFALTFLYTGRSSVTGGEIMFYVESSKT